MKHGVVSQTRRSRQRGNVVVEFALGAGILVFVFTGTFQFGYTFYQYNLLKNAVNNGASYAAMRTYDANSSTPSSAFATAVKNMVVYADPGGGSKPVVPGLTTSNVNLTVGWSTTGSGGTPVSMTLAISNYTISAVVSSTALTGKPAATYPYVGIFAPF